METLYFIRSSRDIAQAARALATDPAILGILGNSNPRREFEYVSAAQEVESQSDDDTEETMDDIPEEDIPNDNDHGADEVMVENEVFF